MSFLLNNNGQYLYFVPKQYNNPLEAKPAARVNHMNIGRGLRNLQRYLQNLQILRISVYHYIGATFNIPDYVNSNMRFSGYLFQVSCQDTRLLQRDPPWPQREGDLLDTKPR